MATVVTTHVVTASDDEEWATVQAYLDAIVYTEGTTAWGTRSDNVEQRVATLVLVSALKSDWPIGPQL